jgi:hypothetical protein
MVGNCDRNPPGWLSPDVGNGGPVGGGCGTCDCETIEQQGDCAVCAASRACEPPHVREIEAGGAVDWRWSGRRFVNNTVDGQTCERSEVPEYGESMTATFCWSEQAGKTGPETVLQDEETICETVEFDYGEQTNVTHSVSPERTDEPTEFILENEAGSVVEVTDPSTCAPVDNPWLSVYPAGDVEMDLTTDCTVCSCEEVEDGSCGICEKACVEPSPSGLASGEQVSYQWDGAGYARRNVEGQTCQERMNFEPGQMLTAEFCWGDPSPATGGDYIRCERTTFEYGQETVRHTIQPERQAQETTFELRNTSGGQIRVQRAESCRMSPRAWMTVRRDGTEPRLTSRCNCSCEDLEEGGDCPACAPVCAVDQVRAIEAGASTSWTWDGRIYETDQVGGRSCTRERIPASGQQFSVEFCWSSEDGPTGPDQRLESETCQTVDFEYGNNPVVHRIIGR